ncbi:MAG TPA: hypothetical protein DCY48_00630 [Candidatus Magasanikbacteria bacterium]|nr:MAG: hypothetical protein A3I74_02210 [Candidatus Magasanikbacteria bacterium RIFCSPLOWO2_02_FULL_47_16]OGH79677.1 MAG: hypothetical protein A3C10_01190 [Candidatus Magasanikbacteria bacterium RIFCSPHIGHO2_02_FULL_48_18]OGH82456.1 MAG: hypothetical protein A3G08_01170 [Candidatus Magasanikbacteria bacterium RIFCSPLOWO2_12_FULL_47_9b]HAZ28266.1 hypothetical protein [Candidatus Magasanikbacteria bacterium]
MRRHFLALVLLALVAFGCLTATGCGGAEEPSATERRFRLVHQEKVDGFGVVDILRDSVDGRCVAHFQSAQSGSSAAVPCPAE